MGVVIFFALLLAAFLIAMVIVAYDFYCERKEKDGNLTWKQYFDNKKPDMGDY